MKFSKYLRFFIFGGAHLQSVSLLVTAQIMKCNNIYINSFPVALAFMKFQA